MLYEAHYWKQTLNIAFNIFLFFSDITYYSISAEMDEVERYYRNLRLCELYFFYF